MIYEWNDNLAIGYPLIDAQHKGLFDAMNEFFSSADPDILEMEEVQKALGYLEEYTQTHFADEEKVQLECGYPGYSNHKRFHEEFKILLRGLKTDLERMGPTRELLGQLEMGIGSWLVDHIEIEDMKIGAHILRMGKIREEMEALRTANQRA
jgi:hemerythrin